MTADEIRAFPIAIDAAQIEDLRARLDMTRFPEKETPDDWSQGIPLAYMREIHAFWRDKYDWRVCETQLNGFGSFMTEIDGLDIHFLHIKSPHENAQPLLLTHGWPGSIVEFVDVIPALTRPTDYGGAAEDAFHLVIPALPGYGFSAKPNAAGWGVQRIGQAWATLMARLGYQGYIAQGGDWGAAVSVEVGRADPKNIRGVHLNFIIAPPDPETMDSLTEDEQAAIAAFQQHQENGTGYAEQQRTRPQTLGYGLVDSPLGQAAWILEKFHAWSDCDGHPENVFARTRLLDNVMLYWLPACGASSARLYWESYGTIMPEPYDGALAASRTPIEILRPSKRWAEKRFTNIVHWREHARGGHFFAMERPQLFIDDMRNCRAAF